MSLSSHFTLELGVWEVGGKQEEGKEWDTRSEFTKPRGLWAAWDWSGVWTN